MSSELSDSPLLRLLQQRGVVQQADLVQDLSLSPKSVQRLLRPLPHYRSLNHNCTFVTLAGTPRFDRYGLWTFNGICFSRHGDLLATLPFLIDHSPNGLTRQSFQALVLTTVHNHVGPLLRQQAIASFVVDRSTVYTSADRTRRQQQEAARRPPPPGLTDPTRLPPGLDCLAVVQLLARLLQTPDASVASLAKFLQARGLPLGAEQVRAIFAFYGLTTGDTAHTAGVRQRLCSHYRAALARLPLPQTLCHRFDPDRKGDTPMLKTKRRQVATLAFARFTAVEVIRASPAQDQAAQPVSPLQALVPKGGRYGWDLIALVGSQTFLKGRALQDVAEELRPLNVPFSSLYDLQLKFLFYFGHLHRQRAGALRDYLARRGSLSWLIDATLEPETPAFFGIQDAHDNLMLGAWKIATESAEAIVPCLQEASALFGQPQRVLHDLSDAMDAACVRAWDSMPHLVCHFHLVRDIGIDLLDEPQIALRERVRQLRLHSRLKEQRNGQTDWLRQHVEDPTALAGLLRGGSSEVPQAVLGRQILVAFHQWLLDYASDGRRQGYPFDPYLLYFHRRVIRASAAMQRLLDQSGVREQAPAVLKNFAGMMRQYLDDPGVREAAQRYEEGFALLDRLREVLRLTAGEEAPLSARYVLAGKDARLVRPMLEDLRRECRQASAKEAVAWRRAQHEVVVTHLDRYWEKLFAEEGAGKERTTNGLEQSWRKCKRKCRKRHGREKLTRDFQSLPAELMLVGNLEQPPYVEVMLAGKLEDLAKHLADTGKTAGAWTQWRQQQKPLNTARLPRHLLRRDNLIEAFVSLYQDRCQGDESDKSPAKIEPNTRHARS